MSELMNAVSKADPVQGALGEMLNSPPPAIDGATAARLMQRHFGITGIAENLACERDANFHVVAEDGRGFTLKVSNPAEPEINTNFQTEALLWLEKRDPSLPVPKVVRALDGRSEFPLMLEDGRSSVIRVLTWIEGLPVVRVGVTPALRRDLARALARLGIAFEGFDHPASGHEILWDVKNALRLRPLVEALTEPDLRKQLSAELDHFDSTVLPVLATLRQRVVHNDLNLHNVVLNPADPDRATGILDFGDMVKTPLIIDMAVAASYHTQEAIGGLEAVCDMVRAYHKVLPLERRELEVLRDLIVARLMTTVAITEGRAARYPQNAAYILRNNGPARAGLRLFATLPREQVTAALLAACNME
ncbi:Ser/Thr protein kinase RdoA (MazF antagonist) [Mycoplana sp. BE70]|uniref:phosphotransferase n=1 Tax=Mycoplana sp. BE70 TaxID=2817775 RepID=UPI002854FAB1|nr:phosphotransferase [Mycoplana sp. BE70]MDR6759321.1 Ser/Thr protein kinase RdoA (MazF antagonist) [Mycoplana sp. BE70]